jgi:hypothetical protein
VLTAVGVRDISRTAVAVRHWASAGAVAAVFSIGSYGATFSLNDARTERTRADRLSITRVADMRICIPADVADDMTNRVRVKYWKRASTQARMLLAEAVQ